MRNFKQRFETEFEDSFSSQNMRLTVLIVCHAIIQEYLFYITTSLKVIIFRQCTIGVIL